VRGTAANGSRTYPAGTIAVANANGSGRENTGSSQFFLVYRETALPPTYSVIGATSAAGLTTLQGIAAKGIAPSATDATPLTGPVTDGRPAQDVTVTSVIAR